MDGAALVHVCGLSMALGAHTYLYNGLRAVIIGWLLDATGGNWTLVFLLLAASRFPFAGVMAAVKA